MYLDHSTSVEDIKALHVLPPSPTDKTVIIDMNAATTDCSVKHNVHDNVHDNEQQRIKELEAQDGQDI